MRVIVLYLCLLIAAIDFAMIFLSVLIHDYASRRTHKYASRAMELVWAAIPCLMLIAAAAPAVKLVITSEVKRNESTRPALTTIDHRGSQ